MRAAAARTFSPVSSLRTARAVFIGIRNTGRFSLPAPCDRRNVLPLLPTQALATAIAAGRPGQVITFDYAIMHLAIFEAVQAYEKRFQPYHVVVANASGSPTAAVAKAAQDTLVGLLPAQTAPLDAAYAAFLAANNLAANDPGVLVGQQTAAGMLNLRANDGRFAVLPPFTGPANPQAGDWNRTLRSVAAAHLHTLGDTARLFALAYIAEADAGITAWDSKRHFVFWRPITAVREGNNDGNPRTAGDPDWKPLINTPNYPDYTSGANALTGAVTKMLALFFRTNKMTFDVTSAYPLAVKKTRTYSRFTDTAQDVVDVRVLQGIHFRFADFDARRQGRLVAKWAFKHALRRIDDDDRDDADDNDDDDDGGR
jgi:hypothetical protein